MKNEKRLKLLGLLNEIVERRCPQYLAALGSGKILTGLETLAIQQAIADELLATGLRDDDEPNERGLCLESLIDFLSREQERVPNASRLEETNKRK